MLPTYPLSFNLLVFIAFTHYTFFMPEILLPRFQKTSILPKKPPSEITSSRVNPFWSHCCILPIFPLLRLSHLLVSYKANQCHTASKRLLEGWVPGLPASRAKPFLPCWGVGVGVGWQGKSFAILAHQRGTKQRPHTEKILQEPNVHVDVKYIYVNAWTTAWKECEDKIYSYSLRTQWQLSLHGQHSLSWPVAIHVAAEILTKMQYKSTLLFFHVLVYLL